MNMQRRVMGITLIGFVIVLIVVGFFGYVAMRLIPVYTEYFGVVKAMEQERAEPGAASKSLDQVRRDLSFKFSTQYVDESNVPPQAISLKREAGASTMQKPPCSRCSSTCVVRSLQRRCRATRRAGCQPRVTQTSRRTGRSPAR